MIVFLVFGKITKNFLNDIISKLLNKSIKKCIFANIRHKKYYEFRKYIIRMKIKYFAYIIITIIVVISIGIWVFRKFNLNNDFYVGQPIDSLNGVVVYYNGGVDNVSGRNITADNYNIGLQYQCVEFVKRYYYEYLNHKMPDSYGHAKDFFDHTVKDGQINTQRNLIQYTNPSFTKPQADDLLIFGATLSNGYGHVAIISNVTDSVIEIVQQNPGAFGKSRVKFGIKTKDNRYYIDNKRILGWLRKKSR